ncbi:MAG TPA: hypothetical protein DCL53_04170 [Thauera sp.]|nr:hypothetical protein [Thauera sp.]
MLNASRTATQLARRHIGSRERIDFRIALRIDVVKRAEGEGRGIEATGLGSALMRTARGIFLGCRSGNGRGMGRMLGLVRGIAPMG